MASLDNAQPDVVPPAVQAGPAIIVPGFEKLGPITRVQAATSDPEDLKTPDADDWDKAYAKGSTKPSGAPNPLAAALAQPSATMPPAGRPNPAALAQALAAQSPPVSGTSSAQAATPSVPGTHLAQGPGEPLLLRDDQDALTAGRPGPGTAGQAGVAAQGMASPSGFGLANIARAVGLGGPAPNLPAAGQPLPNSGQPSAAVGQSAPIAGAASDIRGPRLEELLQKDDQLTAQANAAYAAGKDKLGDSLRKDKEDIEKRYQAIMDQPRDLNAAEAAHITKLGGDPSQYQSVKGEFKHIDIPETSTTLTKEESDALGSEDRLTKSSKGGYTAIPGTAQEKDPEPVRIWKAENADRVAHGKPEISLEDSILMKSQVGKGEKPILGIDGQPIDPSLSGPDVLKAVPPEVARHAQAIIETREKWPTGFAQARNQQLQQALAAAQQAEPGLDETKFNARQAMRKDVESGNGRINLSNVANNTFLKHSVPLSDSIAYLNNTDSVDYNALVNAGAPHLGFMGQSFKDKADAVKQFNENRDAVSNELEKSFHGVGSTAEQAVLRQIQNLNANDAPQTQLGALRAAQQLLAGKIVVNEENYRTTMGDHGIAAWEKEHKRPFGFVIPEAENAVNKVEQMYQNVRSGKGLGPNAGSSPPPVSQHGSMNNMQGAQQAQPPAGQRLSPEDAMKLPSGSQFIGQDGIPRVKH